DALGRAREPEAILNAIKRSLRIGGRLLASVPNAAHPSVRRALALGLDPYGGSGPLDVGQLRLFTRETFALAVEAAGFAVGRLIPLGDVAGDEDGAAAWLAVAYPLPVPGLDVIQAQFREEARARDDA